MYVDTKETNYNRQVLLIILIEFAFYTLQCIKEGGSHRILYSKARATLLTDAAT